MIYSEVVHLDSDNKILIEVLDGRSVRLTFNANPLVVEYDKRKIRAIKVNGIDYIRLGDIEDVFVTIDDVQHVYKIKDIEKIDEKCFLAHTMPRTKSSFFIVPMVINSRIDVRWNQYFVNAYTEFSEKAEDNRIILLFRFFGNADYKLFEHDLKKNKNFIKMEDYDLNHVKFIFKVPDQKNFNLFKEGKYSKMDTDYRFKILDFHGLTRESTVGKVLFKDESRRKQLELELGVKISEDMELYDIPDEKEILV